jgi:hypothetical protein
MRISTNIKAALPIAIIGKQLAGDVQREIHGQLVDRGLAVALGQLAE